MNQSVPHVVAGIKAQRCHKPRNGGRSRGRRFWYHLLSIFPCPCKILKVATFGIAVGLSVIAHCQTVSTWGVTSQGQSLSLAPGCQLYVYALGTDGVGPASSFCQGQTVSVGFSTAELTVCTASNNSFSDTAALYGMEGIGVSGFDYAQGFYNYSLNNSNLTNSIQFTLSTPALVVVIGVGAGQESLAVSGLHDLAFDIPPANLQYTGQPGQTPVLASAHVYLGPGTYTVQETTGELGSPPNPGISAALVGLLIFSSQSNAASSSALPISIPGSSPPPEQGLIAWYPFFTGNANDASGNGNNAASFGSPLYEPGLINCATWLVDDDDDYFSCPVNLNEFTNATIAFWIRVLNYPADGRYELVSNDNGNYGRAINLMGLKNSENGPVGSLQIFYSATPGYIGFSPPLQLGTWNHVAGVWTPTSTTLYLNGNAVLSGPGSTSLLSDLTNVLIGYPGPSGSTYSDYTTACFDDMRIYNRALSPVEIQGLAGQSAGPVPGLFNTGVDANGNLLSEGSIDPHYTLVSSADTNAPGPNSYIVTESAINAVYPNAYPDGASSQWITPSGDTGSCAPGNYIYRTTFDLSGYDTNSVTISGNWWMDDAGLDIRLNGNSTGNSYSPPVTFVGAAFTINHGFINGLNTLDFVISNAQCGSCPQDYTPTGLRVELSGTGSSSSSESPPITITNINVGPVGSGNLTMSIQGAGFGGNFPFNGTSPFLRITNVTEHWEAGYTGDKVTVDVESWTDTNILINGFAGWLNSLDYKFQAGDQLEVLIENPQTQSGFVTGTVTLNQGTLVIDIIPPHGYPMMLNSIELTNFENSLLSQLQQEGLCQASLTPVAVYIVTSPPSLSTEVELDLMCIAMDAPYSIYTSASDLYEVGFLGGGAFVPGATLETEAVNALIPGSASPVGTSFSAATTVPGYGSSAQAYWFNQYGGAWTFLNGATQVEPGGFCDVGTFGCNDHLRVLIPVSSLPQSLDLRNVLANLSYGVVSNDCGAYPPNAYLEEVGSPTNAQVTFGPIDEECYAAGGGQYGLPTFNARILDALGNPIPASVLCPTSPPPFTIGTTNFPPGGGTIAGIGFAYSNSTVTVTATSGSCFSFENWTENGSYLTNSATCTLIATSNENLTANFVANIYTVTTSISPPGGGTVSGAVTTNCGDSVTLTASDSPGYSFAGWTSTDGGVTNWVTNSSPFTFAVIADSNLVANFEPMGLSSITTIASPSQGGSAIGSGIYTNGLIATISATAANCYAFEYWTTNGVPFSFLATNDIIVGTNEIFTANFVPISYNISLSASPGGTVKGGGSFNCGDAVTFYATPDPCYSFATWTESGRTVSGSPDFNFVVDTNHNFRAHFAQITNIVSTSSFPQNGGITSGGGNFGCDSNVTVTAVANSPYSFAGWTENGAFVSALSNYTFTAYGNAVLTANFVPHIPILEFDSPPWYAGDWGLVLQGPVGSNYQLDFSTDLFNWFPATNFVTAGSPFYIIVPGITNDNNGFFRAKIQ